MHRIFALLSAPFLRSARPLPGPDPFDRLAERLRAERAVPRRLPPVGAFAR